MQMRYQAALHPVVKNNLYGFGRKKASIFFIYKKFLPLVPKILQNSKENATVKRIDAKLQRNTMTIFFSVSRHEPYDRYGAKYPITPSGIADAWISGSELEKYSCPVDVIYSSPLARAKATAAVRGKSINCRQIIINNALYENALPEEIFEFCRQIIADAQNKKYRHIHLVTHQPVIAAMGEPYSTSPGTIYIQKAESWEDIMPRKTEVLKLAPTEERLYALQFENPREYDKLAARYNKLADLAKNHEGSLEDLLTMFVQAESALQVPTAFRTASR